MRLIYFSTNIPDYVCDSLLHGLRQVMGNDCVDVQRSESLYKPLPQSIIEKLGNNGFFIYGLLEDNDELKGRRFFWERDADLYDGFIIPDIWNQWYLLWYLLKKYPKKKFAVIDGHDINAVFPFKNIRQRLSSHARSFFTPLRRVKYFKRELTGGASNYNLANYLHPALSKLFTTPKNIYTINMSIPKEKITKIDPSKKTNMFVSYLVDKELGSHITTSDIPEKNIKKHLFLNEAAYIEDIRKAKFGSTVKRAGWDCLRHYEYASQGTILCFKNLDEKPESCAPHGLNAGNSIIYKNANELLNIINNLTEEKYRTLYDGTYRWIEANTTENVAKKFLDEFYS